MGRRSQQLRCGKETGIGKQNRLLGYDWAAKEGRLAITHTKRAFQIPEGDQFESGLETGLNVSRSFDRRYNKSPMVPGVF